MPPVPRARRLPLVLLSVALLLAAATAGVAHLRPAPAPNRAEGVAGRCDAPSRGGEGYTVSGVSGSVVAGLTVRPAGARGRGRLVLQLISPNGPLARQRPVLVPARSGSPISLLESTPGCYTATGTLTAGQVLSVRGFAGTGGRPLALRLPLLVRPAAAVIRRARSTTMALGAVHELQRIAPSDGSRPVTLSVDYAGRVIRERSPSGLRRSVVPGWRRYFFWMLPGGVALPRQIGWEWHGGRRLVVVSGALRDVEGFIRLLVDPRSGRVRAMRFLAAGHIMHSVYNGFRPAATARGDAYRRDTGNRDSALRPLGPT
jgi:hypothetical protein